MVEMLQIPAVETLNLAPKNPLPYVRQLQAVRSYIEGLQTLLDAGGPVTRLRLAPKWLLPDVVVIATPQGARDLLGRNDEACDRGRVRVMVEMRALMGGNLLNLPHERWLPRRRALQPMFTKRHVAGYAGHMGAAAQQVADGWRAGAIVDLDSECRLLTLRALGRSVLGVDLDERAEEVGHALRVSLTWVADRAARPVNPPRWLPTSGQRAARRANDTLHGLAAEILHAVRADPDRDASLVRALIEAVDPQTGRPLTDDEICEELVLFMLAGHDTTSTTLTYALWALGHHRHIQDQLRAEVDALGQRALTTDDVPQLGVTVRVLHEALRLCPPAAGTARMPTQDIVVDGYLVPAKTIALVSIYAMHRDPALWEDPARFDPDRFLPERSKGRSRWQYLPFGGGPRSCIGDHFAMLEATLALATIIRTAEIDSLDDDFLLATPFTVVAAKPIHAHIYPRAKTATHI
ncbi:cytochrome P450 [Mycobacterium montefiorense]|uniref:Cytochrome P450 n=1 Tax=Mycobacterium montefiorense TaxID=154654 RepID=A0AA37PQT5_9MYCO|nr:cytochrome P450 [Mycobacterium montefiorense]GBG36109.1 cytochrome P450 [Mycobacterium montefiorense]GKU33122.1 cytochrome P450 [Mycobacterium montefiorense]GKU38408.1 cytochrome P450 [Mycobacterium montefiorense]GKU46826.1 cytochrome P450 [Mycobacterium montefiorense]GKU51402.1 cytochrome P450 [Mycobacterium montefiorense]